MHTREADRLRGYRLNDPDLKERFDYHSREGMLGSLRQEVTLLRSMIEQRLDLARTEADKVAAFNVVTPAINSLDKLVNSIVKLERTTNMVLEKDAAKNLAEGIVQVLTEELRGQDTIIDRIAKKIAGLVAEAHNARD